MIGSPRPPSAVTAPRRPWVIGAAASVLGALGIAAASSFGPLAGILPISMSLPAPIVAAPQGVAVTATQALLASPNRIVLQAISRSLASADGEASDELHGEAEGEASDEENAEQVDGEANGEENAEEDTWPIDPRLAEIYWTAPEGATTDLLAANWGLGRQLFVLNPDLRPGEKVAAGTRLKVYAADPRAPTRSVGHPNRGRLQRGMPLPEGESWRLRPNRRRAFGTQRTIAALVHAFEAYGERYPGAPPVRVGELARRSGGRVSPHASHRTGRDVDLGYIGAFEDDGEVRWTRMTKDLLDVEKTWFLVKALIDTGAVDTIFMSSRLQRLLEREAAAQGVSEAERQRIFQHPRHPESVRSIVKHWRGHVNHLHVRFRCETWNSRCRGERKATDPEDGLGSGDQEPEGAAGDESEDESEEAPGAGTPRIASRDRGSTAALWGPEKSDP